MYIPITDILTRVSIPDIEQNILTMTLDAFDALKEIKNSSSMANKTVLAHIENYKLQVPKDATVIEYVSLYVNADEELDACLDEDFPADSSETEHNIPIQALNNQITAIYPLLPWSFLTSNVHRKYFEVIKPRRVPYRYACTKCPKVELPCNYYYDINSSNQMVFPQLETGVVCISYSGFITDANGDILIHDNEYLKKALVSYIMMRYHEVRMNMNIQGAAALYKNYQSLYSLHKRQYTADCVTERLDPDAVQQIMSGNWKMFLRDAIKYQTTV